MAGAGRDRWTGWPRTSSSLTARHFLETSPTPPRFGRCHHSMQASAVMRRGQSHPSTRAATGGSSAHQKSQIRPVPGPMVALAWVACEGTRRRRRRPAASPRPPASWQCNWAGLRCRGSRTGSPTPARSRAPRDRQTLPDHVLDILTVLAKSCFESFCGTQSRHQREAESFWRYSSFSNW